MRLKDLGFADDVDLLAESALDLQTLLRALDDRSKRFRLKINTENKVMVFERRATTSASHLNLGGTDVEEVEEFVYLDSLLNTISEGA